MEQVKEVKKITHNKNLDLFIFEQLRKGLNPAKICKQFHFSKQKVDYHLSLLKERKLVKKVGYGTYEILKDFEKRSPKIRQKDNPYGFNKIVDVDELIDTQKLRKVLKFYNLNHCLFCNFPQFEFHHIEKKSEGGQESLRNLIPVCPNHHELIHKQGISGEMQEQINKYHRTINQGEELRADMVRGHAFQFTLSIDPKLRNWDKREAILTKLGIEFKPLNIFGGGQSLVFKDRKVWLTNKSIVIFEKSSYMAETSKEAKQYAIHDFISFVEALERHLKADFGATRGKLRFKVSRQHYALIKNALAKQFDKEGKHLYVTNETGRWFIIDNSFNLHEAETIHPKTADQDNKKVQDFFNGIKQYEGFTPKFVIDAIGQNAQNLDQYAIHLKAHVESVQKLGSAVEELTKVVKEIKK